MNRWIVMKIVAVIVILFGMKFNHRPITMFGVGLGVAGLFMSRQNIGKIRKK